MRKPNIPVVYVAGPFRATQEDGTANQWEQAQNIRRAESLALEVWKLGAAAICPHLNTIHFQGALPDDVWLYGDLAILATCDALVMTADWRRSSGARDEVEFAREHGIPVFESIHTLRRWLFARLQEEP